MVNNSVYGTPNQVREYERFVHNLKEVDGNESYLTFIVYQLVHFFDAYHK